MKPKKLLTLTLLVVLTLLLTQCKKGGMFDILDDDSDRPEWAQGNKEENPHIGRIDTVENMKGDEYGDLYVLLRNENGMPEMRDLSLDFPELTESFWVVQPIDASGSILELTIEGEPKYVNQAIEVEFGRLNLIRSPQMVIDHAMEEAMATILKPNAVISFDFAGRIMVTYMDDTIEIIKTIDSPLENLAIYQHVMQNMFTAQNRLGFLGNELEIASGALGGASDKTSTMTLDRLIYINGFADILGINPLANTNEILNNEVKKYFNFLDYDAQGHQFSYNRQNRYQNRYLEIHDWATFTIDTVSVFTYMTDNNKFSTYGNSLSPAETFAIAVDDAIQVIEAVHEDSNIIYLPDYIPPAP